MRESMGWQGEGRRFTRAMFNREVAHPAGANLEVSRDPSARGVVLSVALMAMALAGCAESAAGAASTASSSTSTSMATPANVTATSPADSRGARPAATERIVQRLNPAQGRLEAERPENATSAATARGSEPSVSDTTITPRHLEAELNRLEAELAN